MKSRGDWVELDPEVAETIYDFHPDPAPEIAPEIAQRTAERVERDLFGKPLSIIIPKNTGD